jgi:hypothetical protein
VTARLFRLLTGEEFKRLSVEEMVAYRRKLAAHLHEHIDDSHQSIAVRSKKVEKAR